MLRKYQIDLQTSLEKPPIFETSLRVVAACKYGYISTSASLRRLAFLRGENL
jgi:hypothetical protein